ncbi:MAG: hypothetical protein QF535_07000, partial [Anaerolineales bacterium]|nr:hypothetical protein [Anaerolineales bacterium]
RDPASWYHLCVVLDTTQASASNRVKMYVNGEQITDFSTSNDPTQDAEFAINNNIQHNIGSENGSGNYFDGYLAEVHFIDGTALDASSFGETDAATNQWKPIEFDGTYGTNGFYQKYSSTELANSFTDSSSSAHTITANGDVTNTRAQAKIGDSSIKFDGSGDYLSVADGSDFAFGTGNFTLETWVNFSTVQNQGIMLLTDAATSYAPYFQYYGGELQFGINGIASVNTYTWTPTADTWYHVAVARSGSTCKLFIDGTEVDSGSNSTDFISDGLLIGAWSSRDWNGYMDEVRISRTARYTANFTPSTTAFQDDKDTVLLLHMDGGGGIDPATNLPTLLGQGTYFWDASTNAIFYGANGIPTNKSLISFDGTGDYL